MVTCFVFVLIIENSLQINHEEMALLCVNQQPLPHYPQPSFLVVAMVVSAAVVVVVVAFFLLYLSTIMIMWHFNFQFMHRNPS